MRPSMSICSRSLTRAGILQVGLRLTIDSEGFVPRLESGELRFHRIRSRRETHQLEAPVTIRAHLVLDVALAVGDGDRGTGKHAIHLIDNKPGH